MARNSDSFFRSKSRYKPQPLVLAICEDSKSGLQYLREAARHFRADVKVEISHCGRTDPKGIVEEALSRQKKFDHVYCVIDRDSHENFDEAIALAKESDKITVIDSHPCFEFWLVLHHKKTRRPYASSGKNSSADNLIKDLRREPEFNNYCKGAAENIFNSLIGDKFAFARKTSPQVLKEAVDDNNLNPSTKVHLLIDAFEEMTEPKPLE
ncbi:MAG: RloB domain-containing protein [Nitrosomonadales bacterium]|nr:RloB domain-containing protein [Nitrosomonadales bacterium]